MSYIGDYAEDYATLNIKFTTIASDGTPTTLLGTPIIKVYKANQTTTETTTGITLAVDFDSVTGLNNVLIDLSSDVFYATGFDYQVIITTGTVDGTSVVGYVVAEFSIENRYMRGTDGASPASEYDTEMARITADVATEAKQDIIDGIVDSILVDTTLIEQLLKNRLDVDVSGSQMILYADDGTTPLITWALTDKGGSSIDVATGVPTERGTPT